MKHYRKRWVRRQRHKKPDLIAMYNLGEIINHQQPCIFRKVEGTGQRRPMLQ